MHAVTCAGLIFPSIFKDMGNPALGAEWVTRLETAANEPANFTFLRSFASGGDTSWWEIFLQSTQSHSSSYCPARRVRLFLHHLSSSSSDKGGKDREKLISEVRDRGVSSSGCFSGVSILLLSFHHSAVFNAGNVACLHILVAMFISDSEFNRGCSEADDSHRG